MRRVKKNKPITIAIQGIAGSYSHQAAEKLAKIRGWSKVKLIYCSSFSQAFAQLNQEKADFAVLPYKNSLVGEIKPVASQIENYQLVARLSLPINHVLATVKTKPSPKLSQVEYVYSHPVALAQCQKLFRRYPWLKKVEYEDTAAAARLVAKKGDPQNAAICSSLAVRLFRLYPLKREIQDHPRNFTSFALLKLLPDPGSV